MRQTIGFGEQRVHCLKRIVRRDGREGFVARVAARGAQRVDGVGKRKLFADDGCDEPAAADFTARFHTAQRHQEIAPPRCQGFARNDVAKDDAPSTKQAAREEFGVDAPPRRL